MVDGIADRARRLKVGPGIDADSEMGPLVSQEQFERVSGYLESGVADGASAVAGGKPHRRGPATSSSRPSRPARTPG